MKATRDHFRAVTGMANDLREDMRNAKNLASTSYLVRQVRPADRTAAGPQRGRRDAEVQRICRRAVAAGVAGGEDDGDSIRGPPGADHRRATFRPTPTAPPAGAVTAPTAAWAAAGWAGAKAEMAEVKEVGAERRVVRAEEKGDHGHRRPADPPGDHRRHGRHPPQDDPEVPGRVPMSPARPMSRWQLHCRPEFAGAAVRLPHRLGPLANWNSMIRVHPKGAD